MICICLNRKINFICRNSSDLLTWHIVPKDNMRQKFEKLEQFQCRDIRINLKVAPRTKLGLGYNFTFMSIIMDV